MYRATYGVDKAGRLITPPAAEKPDKRLGIPALEIFAATGIKIIKRRKRAASSRPVRRCHHGQLINLPSPSVSAS